MDNIPNSSVLKYSVRIGNSKKGIDLFKILLPKYMDEFLINCKFHLVFEDDSHLTCFEIA